MSLIFLEVVWMIIYKLLSRIVATINKYGALLELEPKRISYNIIMNYSNRKRIFKMTFKTTPKWIVHESEIVCLRLAVNITYFQVNPPFSTFSTSELLLFWDPIANNSKLYVGVARSRKENLTRGLNKKNSGVKIVFNVKQIARWNFFHELCYYKRY